MRVSKVQHSSSRGGETGRHASFRYLWGKPCGGSSPLLGKLSFNDLLTKLMYIRQSQKLIVRGIAKCLPVVTALHYPNLIC